MLDLALYENSQLKQGSSKPPSWLGFSSPPRDLNKDWQCFAAQVYIPKMNRAPVWANKFAVYLSHVWENKSSGSQIL